jgi:putative hemolysin
MTEAAGLVICVERGGNGPMAEPSGRKSAFDDSMLNNFGLPRPPKEINAGLIQSESAYKYCFSQHGQLHNKTDAWIKDFKKNFPDQQIPMNVATAHAAQHVEDVTGCDKENIEKQLNNYHKDRGLDPKTTMLHPKS